MSEWLKEHAWKACVGETLPWVRIPLSPPYPICKNGEVPERSNGAVSKTVDRATGPWVRIPPSPPCSCLARFRGLPLTPGPQVNYFTGFVRSGRARPGAAAPAIPTPTHLDEKAVTRETHLSTQQPPPQADPWIPGSDAHPPRARRAVGPAPEGAQAPERLMPGSQVSRARARAGRVNACS